MWSEMTKKPDVGTFLCSLPLKQAFRHWIRHSPLRVEIKPMVRSQLSAVSSSQSSLCPTGWTVNKQAGLTKAPSLCPQIWTGPQSSCWDNWESSCSVILWDCFRFHLNLIVVWYGGDMNSNWVPVTLCVCPPILSLCVSYNCVTVCVHQFCHCKTVSPLRLCHVVKQQVITASFTSLNSSCLCLCQNWVRM